jgi:hypothetical protein
MNRVINIFLPILLFCYGFSIDNEKVASGIEWEKTEHDFGKIEQKKLVTATFQFRNPSMVPLIITAVEPSCGCTIAEYPKEPVRPGKSATISVTYDSETTGYFKKSITVLSNAAQSPSIVYIKGEVVNQLR